MELLIIRKTAIGDAQPGDLQIDGRLTCYALERVSKAIPAGRYRLTLTVSQRALSGELWSPDPEKRLPLINDVPGREGIRMHALNEAEESEGCVGVGQRRALDRIVRSRAALTALIPVLDAALACGPVWVTLQDPLPEGTKRT